MPLGVRAGEAGGFTATPISGRDWGVIDLDSSGDYKLFFQFVPVEEEHVPFYATPKFKLIALAHMLITSNVLAGKVVIRYRPPSGSTR